jgi:hypothetical protein
MLRDVRSWDPDIEGLVEAISRGELNSRVSAEIGGHDFEPARVSLAAKLDNVSGR